MKVLLVCEPEETGALIFFSEDPTLTYVRNMSL